MTLRDLIGELREAAEAPAGPGPLKRQVTTRRHKSHSSFTPAKKRALGRPGTVGRKRFSGIGRRKRETPDDYRKRTGQCPPGYRFDGVHCRPGQKKPGEERLPGQTQPTGQEVVPPSKKLGDEQEQAQEREKKLLAAPVPGFKNVAEFAQKESDEYFENEFCNNLFPDAFKTRDEFIKAVAEAPTVPKDDWRKLHDWGGDKEKHSLKDVADLVWGMNQGRWLPQTGGDEAAARKLYDGYFAKLVQACKDGKVPPTLVGKWIGPDHTEVEHIIGGNTRMMIHTALGLPTPTKTIPLPGRMRPVNDKGWFDTLESTTVAHKVLFEYRRLGLLTCGYDDELGLSTEPRTRAAHAKKVQAAEDEVAAEAERLKKLASVSKRIATRVAGERARKGPDSEAVEGAPAEARRILARLPRDSWWRADKGEVKLAEVGPDEFYEQHTALSRKGSALVGTPRMRPTTTPQEKLYFRERVIPAVIVAATRAVERVAGAPVTFLAEDRIWWKPSDLAAHYPNEGEQYQVAVALHDRFRDRVESDTWDDEEVALTKPGARVWETLTKLAGSGPKAHTAISAMLLAQGSEPLALKRRGVLTVEAVEYLKERGLDIDRPGPALQRQALSLAFPLDSGKPHSELSAVVAGYTALRQQNLLKKMQEVEARGGVAIVTPDAPHAWNLKFAVEESL